MKVKQGHLLHARSRVQGQAARADRRRSRLCAEALPRPRREVAVAVAARRQARRRATQRARRRDEDRQVRLRRAAGGTRGRRPLHAADPAQRSPTCAFSTCSRSPTPAPMAREVVEAYGNDIGAHPVGTGPVHARPATSAARRSSSSPIPTIARSPTRRAARFLQRRRPVAAALKGKRLPRTPRVDIRIIEEGPGAVARVPQPRGRPARACCRPSSRRRRSTDGKLKPELAAQGHRPPAADAAERGVHLLQHGGPGRRRLHAREDRAAPRDQHGLQPRRGDPRALLRPRASRAAARSRRTSPATIPRSRPARSSTIPRPRARCSTSTATRIATATASASCPTASR